MAKIVVLATGGTIAGKSSSAGDGVAYQAAQIGVEDLLENVPGLRDLLGADTLEGEQIAQINSKDMEFAVWQRLAQRCAHWLAQADVRGIVVTHGTDTIEETAFFLQQTLASVPNAEKWQDKPVLLTCAMRPATARLSDGPQNLADTISVAQDTQARGVMVVVAGQVHDAAAVEKIHPYRLDAFSSGDGGPLAYVEESAVRWLRTPPGWPQQAEKGLWQALADTPPAQWPWVETLHSHTNADPRALQALAQAGVQGVVLVGTGNATLHQALEQAAQPLQDQGLALLLAPRCTASAVVRSAASAADPVPLAWYGAGQGSAPIALPASKARLLLLLRLLAQAGTMQAAS
ncbi:MAG: asparaginase [Brachymonas sp.]|nr:asparaginase [Brachymonas sp.]